MSSPTTIRTAARVRSEFLEFFSRKLGHTVVPSSPVVPHDDPTLLFTNAGMNQFKDVFLGRGERPYARAVDSQKCIRAGGKHNDLENVGVTARHHTFFEMLGNFSFGDYFKSEACSWAWEFLTDELAIPKERLWITIHDSDDEAHAIWVNEVGIPAERVVCVGDATNDIPMFEAAGLSVAMGDGMPEALAAADRVIGASDTDAISELVEELFGVSP